MDGKRFEGIPKNYRTFLLDYSNDPEKHGWGIEKDLEKAKTYYSLAYKEGHGLARKKLKEWNFLD